MTTLQYASNKTLASALRAVNRFNYGSFPSSPDEVLQIPSRDASRMIKANVYKSASKKKPIPVLLNFHGSGFILPIHGSDDEFCRYIAKETEFIVLDVQYRLAPEKPFPAAVEDAEDAIQYVLKRPDEFDAKHIATSGFSAGGNLALAAASTSSNKVDSVIAFYTVVDLDVDPATRLAPAPGSKTSAATTFIMRTFNDCYLPKGVDRRQPRASPAFADPKNFPQNVLSITCSEDSLALEMEDLAQRIKAVPGKNVVQRRLAGVGHAWDKTTKPGTDGEKTKDEAYALATEFLRARLKT